MLVQITEGSASIQVPTSNDSRKVFYNKVQAVNRDLSICVIQSFIDLLAPRRKVFKHRNRVRILEALSASGLRSIRYAKEINGIERIIANDMDPVSVANIKENVKLNGVSLDCITPNCDDANELMERLNRKIDQPRLFVKRDDAFVELLQQLEMDIIDLDPYGSAVPFLERGVGTIADGGLLCVTSTDSAVLCGKYPEKCSSLYGSLSFKSDYCHEFAVRTLLAALERTANRHGKYIKPLLSLHIDFYVRVFVQIYKQPCQVKLSATKLSYVAQCSHCCSFQCLPSAVKAPIGKRERSEESPVDIDTNFELSNSAFRIKPASLDIGSKCNICTSRWRITGPIYNQPIHDIDFALHVQKIIKDDARMHKFARPDRVEALLNCIINELNDVPLYYNIAQVCSSLHLTCPPTIELTSALNRLGFRTSQTHCNPQGIKTDAPTAVIYGVLKHWANSKGLSDNYQGSKVLVEPIECNFVADSAFDISGKSRGIKKFLPNPEADWGPKARHRN